MHLRKDKLHTLASVIQNLILSSNCRILALIMHRFTSDSSSHEGAHSWQKLIGFIDPESGDWIIRKKSFYNPILLVSACHPLIIKNSQRRHIKLEGRKRKKEKEKSKPTRAHSPTTNFRVSCFQFFDVSSLANKHFVCSLFSNHFCLQHGERVGGVYHAAAAAAAAAQICSRILC